MSAAAILRHRRAAMHIILRNLDLRTPFLQAKTSEIERFLHSLGGINDQTARITHIAGVAHILNEILEMKLNMQVRFSMIGIAVFLALPGCNNLPSTGRPIAGAPDGVAEVMVLAKDCPDCEVKLEEAKFLDLVARTDQKLVLVDFWATWCGPCRQMAPSLEELKKKWGDELEVVKVDVDQNSEISAHLGVNSIPDVRIFRNGVQVGDFVGVMPKDEIDALLRSLQ